MQPLNATPVFNGIAPQEKPKAIPLTVDFSTGLSQDFDFTLIQQNQARISFVQAIFVDNWDSAQPVSFMCQTTNHRVVCPANAQGYFPIFIPNAPRFTVSTPSGTATAKLQILNFPVPAAVWTQFSPSGTFFDLLVTHNLTVGNNVTVGGNVTITGNVNAANAGFTYVNVVTPNVLAAASVEHRNPNTTVGADVQENYYVGGKIRASTQAYAMSANGGRWRLSLADPSGTVQNYIDVTETSLMNFFTTFFSVVGPAASDVFANIVGDAGQNRGIFFRTGVTNRWLIQETADAESGGNAGSNFVVAAYTDAGAFSFRALTIARNTGDITIQRDISVREIYGLAANNFNVQLGLGNLATTATQGFPKYSYGSGAPTGALTGSDVGATYWDNTNFQHYVWTGTVWKKSAVYT